MIDIISATRLTKFSFLKSPLGYSLIRLQWEDRYRPCVAYNNVYSLPKVYNQRITAPDASDILLFVHDDVWLDDYYVCQRIEDGLKEFDVIGIAGSRHRVPNQPSWCLTTEWKREPRKVLSGGVGHGSGPFSKVDMDTPAPTECEVLDGVFLAVRTATLLDAGLLFDERFRFHLYDIDFSRQARQKGLRLGTWPIAITHSSKGNYDDPAWKAGRDIYFAKWGD